MNELDAVLEYNDSGVTLWSLAYPGAFARAETTAEAAKKLPAACRRYRLWAKLPPETAVGKEEVRLMRKFKVGAAVEEGFTDVLFPDADVWVTLTVNNTLNSTVPAEAALVLKQQEYIQRITLAEALAPGENSIEALFAVKEVLPWLPNGSGEASVYELMAGIKAEGAVQDAASRLAAICETEVCGGRLVVNGKAVSAPVAVVEKPLSALNDGEIEDVKDLGFCGIKTPDAEGPEARDKCAAAGLLVFGPETEMPLVPLPSKSDGVELLKAAAEAARTTRKKAESGFLFGVGYPEASGEVMRYFVRRALQPAALDLVDGLLRMNNRSLLPFKGSLVLDDAPARKIAIGPGETLEEPFSGRFARLEDDKGRTAARAAAAGAEGMPRLFVSRFLTEKDEYRLAIASDGYAPCVEIECSNGGVLSDNWFAIFPGESAEIKITGCKSEPEIVCRVYDPDAASAAQDEA